MVDTKKFQTAENANFISNQSLRLTPESSVIPS